MPRRRSLPPVYRNQPLPECQGPKLAPFRYRHAPIKFISRLGVSNDEGSESNVALLGAHGFVFKVSVKSKFYALKLVSSPLVPQLLG
jgi:Kinetochore Sim4 complex subunit FTA2